MTDHRTIWGSRVRAAREEQGISRTQLAAKAGLSYGTITSIEQGIRGAGDEVRLRLAAALQADVNELFSYPTGSAA